MDNTKEKVTGKKTPGLAGFSFEPQEAILARDQKRLLSIRIEINTTCNLNCRYCFAQCSKKIPQEVEFHDFQKLIYDAASLGVRSVIFTGGGEPLLHSRFKEIITCVNQCGMLPVIFSNSILITPELSGFLYQNNVSVMAKLDSLRPAAQDNLAGFSGAYVGIQAGLHNLIEAGFSHPHDPSSLRLGVSFVANNINVNEIEELWHFCRRNFVYPHIQLIYPDRAADVFDLMLSPAQVKRFKQRLHAIDKIHYNYNWLPLTPFIAGGCLQHFYSLYITVNGNIRPCVYTNFDEHPYFLQNGKYPFNAFEQNLSDLYHSEPFAYARSIDRYLEGKCAVCNYLPNCIGCRGHAYRIGVSNGLSPYEALRISCQRCVR